MAILLPSQRKSQLAIEYSYQTRDRLPDTWVFWVHASNAARFKESYREIADRVRIAGRKGPKANVVKLVYDWLCDRKDEKWILILDNVDDARFLYEASPLSREGPGSGHTSRQPLLAYLPQSPNGSILMTTRTREVALKLVEQRDIITVEPMDEAHAVTLLEKKLGMRGDGNDIAELVGALDFMPLAIVQAAAYIMQRAPRCSVQQYLEDFRNSNSRKTSLLNHEAGHLRRDWGAKNSIITTWQISFDYICEVRLSAADLLSLMSFFDRQGIPETLIRCRDLQQNHRKLGGSDVDKDDNNDTISESTIDDGFEEDVMTLRSYSFISVNADQITFEMHRLVQLATQTWLVSHAQLERWKQQFIKNLAFDFPNGEYENWERCQLLYPHAKSAIAQRPGKTGSLRECASLLHKAAWYALDRGNLDDAEKMSECAMKARSKLFGQDHPSTLSSMGKLASTYREQGQWDKAEKLEVEVMETSKTKLGADHPNTLCSIENLASTYSYQGRLDEAEQLYAEVLKTSKRKLGEDHPDTLTSMNNLASTYRDQGRWDAAKNLFGHVIETSRRKLGADHPVTLSSMNNLASTYSYQGW
jgi:tetratricopeptide (TPR) repeat protein